MNISLISARINQAVICVSLEIFNKDSQNGILSRWVQFTSRRLKTGFFRISEITFCMNNPFPPLFQTYFQISEQIGFLSWTIILMNFHLLTLHHLLLNKRITRNIHTIISETMITQVIRTWEHKISRLAWRTKLVTQVHPKTDSGRHLICLGSEQIKWRRKILSCNSSPSFNLIKNFLKTKQSR